MIVLAQCRLLPEPGVPLYNEIISITDHLQPPHDDGIQIEQANGSQPDTHNYQAVANREKPIQPTQIGEGAEIADKLLERGEGKETQ